MNRLSSMIPIAALISLALSAYAQYNSPESVVFDAVRNRYLISNAGNGTISTRDTSATGTVTIFATGMSSPKGLIIIGDTLFATDVTTVRAIPLSTGTIAYSIACTGSSFLNDITGDTTYLYIGDMGTNRIYRIQHSTRTASVWVPSGISSPNGLLLEPANNRLIVVSFSTVSPIVAVSLTTSTISNIIANTGFSQLDGIAVDGAGRYYVTSWSANAVYRYNNDFTSPTAVVTGVSGPADIGFNARNNILAIPVMNENRIVLYRVETTDMKERSVTPVKQFSLSNAYPNPFNSSTTISYALPQSGNVEVLIYNLSGQLIRTFTQTHINPGTHRIVWNSRDDRGIPVSSGTYFYRLRVNNEAQSKQMILLK